ncbi:hypothetical protein [Telluribacter sp. SYSU D00476]|uniref:hypothetical protein n=1 Tax=Telluribacter sp. SYSU D00476 TaxID=2811430 RepID=UPI001FF42570|nr:hypothetical protein [Telluribacter sp. SYSU D00476]
MKLQVPAMLLWLTLATSCQFGKGASYTPSQPFRDYWYNGQAEISRYSLQQVQYGAQNPGEAVLIFVTEDFLTDKQVKLETEDNSGDATSVLKLNSIRRFVTGIYDYSLYSSVFTPVNTEKYPHSLKVTMSAQDWCGQTYTQLNRRGKGYEVMGRSYFEKNVEEDYSFNDAWLEDEIWTRLRFAPDQLPIGDTEAVPAAYAARLTGQPLEPQKAIGSMTAYEGTVFKGRALNVYSLLYPEHNRELRIVFEKAFPHEIAGWEETYTSRGKVLTTRAVRTSLIRSEYWKHNAPGDTTLRQQLGARGF